MIRLAGLEPHLDVKIDFVGLRPGEKLYEELFDECERRQPSSIPGIFEARPAPVPLGFLREVFDDIAHAAASGNSQAVRMLVRSVLNYTKDETPAAVPAPASVPVFPAMEPILATLTAQQPAQLQGMRAFLLRPAAATGMKSARESGGEKFMFPAPYGSQQ